MVLVTHATYTICGDIEVEETTGWLTITGIPSQFEGKSIIAYGYKGGVYSFTACKKMEENSMITYIKVENGRAELNVYENDTDQTKFTDYTGNDKGVSFSVIGSKAEYDNATIGFVTADFISGAATAQFRLPY